MPNLGPCLACGIVAGLLTDAPRPPPAGDELLAPGLEAPPAAVEPDPVEPDPVEPAATPYQPPCLRWDLETSTEARQQRARIEVERADRLNRDGAHSLALAAIGRAECYWDHRDYDFMRGVILQASGDCLGSVAAFKRFLDQDPPTLDARAARARLRTCVERRTPPPVPTPPRYANRDRWSPDLTDSVLLGTGGACVVLGLALGIAGSSAVGAKGSDDGSPRVRRERVGVGVAAGVMAAAGAGMIIAAVIRHALVSRRRRSAALARRATPR